MGWARLAGCGRGEESHELRPRHHVNQGKATHGKLWHAGNPPATGKR